MRNAITAAILAIAAIGPVTVHAQTAPRVAMRQAEQAPPAPMPDIDLVTALRHGASTAARQEAAAAPAATLSYPYGVAVDSSSNVYVTNLFGGVCVYNYKLAKTGAITTGVSFPTAVSVVFNGNIYVANNGTSNVTIYNPSLTQIGTITDTALVQPISMFVDAEDTAWVLDAQGMLHAYLNDGTTLTPTHTGGNAVGPWGPNVTVWGIANSAGGYDEDFENRAQAVNAGPNLFNVYGQGSPYAAGEAQDQNAQEYVSDPQHKQIQVWSRNGANEIGIITTPAPAYGVAVDPALNRLYVALTNLNEVYVYQTRAPYKLLAVIH